MRHRKREDDEVRQVEGARLTGVDSAQGEAVGPGTVTRVAIKTETIAASLCEGTRPAAQVSGALPQQETGKVSL